MEQNKNVMNEEVVVDYTDDQRTEITNKANDQYLKMAKEGKYKDILVKFGQNGNYSLNNLLYMLSQNPNATIAKGMGEWERAGRSIKKGAKSMEIMAPTKEEYEVAAKDEAGNDMYDEDGVQIMNKRERTIGFHPNYVFDVKDTEGEKYESYKIGEKISDAEKSIILEGVRRALQTKRYRMVFTNGADFADGENFKVDVDSRTLKVKKNMKNAETSLAAIEGASKALCAYKNRNFEGLKGKKAEIFEDASIKCILAARYGLDTSGMEFGYMQKLGESDLLTLRENLSSVCTGTKVVMDRVTSSFARAEREKAQNAMPTGISALNDLFDKEDFQDKSAGKDDMEVA